MEIKNIDQPILGAWYIDEKIGSGAFGTVYKIKREEFGETYYSALKVINIPSDNNDLSTLRNEGMDDVSITLYYKELVQNLLSEIKILNSLKGNSNIVSYEDHKIISNENETKFTIFIRMELLIPLKDYMINNNPSENDVAKLGMDLCNALKLCEKNNIIHRDIKPDNIFVSNNGDFKLGDFGVARTVEKTMSQMSKKGTYTYMAPEVYLNKPYDNRADIYSLGLILYQLLNKNRAPFLPLPPDPIKFSDREKATERRIAGEDIPPLNIKNSALEKVVIKACDANSDERYSTAEEFYCNLNNAISKENKAMNEVDFDKTISPFGNTEIQNTNNEPQSEVKNEQDFDKTLSPFRDVILDSNSPETDVSIPNDKPKKNIAESFKLFFKNYTNFNGRTRRSDYWNLVLVNIIISVAFSVLSGIFGSIAAALLSIYSLAILLPSLAIGVRRLHDIGKKSVYILFGLIPIAGPIVLIVWFAKDSQKSTNEYGPNPKIN
ncbi:MAG: DUF805 domain-containing protein [Eubacterium sp.]|nr:DUF805 domain-containing protein [Eubacterium sp.]